MPLFSVIIPVYSETEALIRRSTASVLGDSFCDLEVILVEDGSPNGAGEVCDAIAATDDRVHVVHKENGGLASSRNAGITHATGQYVAFLDADDWMDADSFQRLSAYADGTAQMIKYGWHRIEGEDVEDCLSSVEKGIYTREAIVKDIIPTAYGGNKMSHSTIPGFLLSSTTHLYLRRFLEEYELRFISEREVGSEDFLFNMEAYQHLEYLTVTDLVLYNYELREGSITQVYRERLFDQYLCYARHLKTYLESHGLYEENRYHYVSAILSLLYICMMNACAKDAPEGRENRISNLNRIIEHPEVRTLIAQYAPRDIRNRIIAFCMKHHLSSVLYRVLSA